MVGGWGPTPQAQFPIPSCSLQGATGLRREGYCGPMGVLPTCGRFLGDPATVEEGGGVGGAARAWACCVSLMIFNEQLPLVILLISEYQ